MTYERKQINSAPRGPVKPSRNRSGLIRAIRRIKPSPAYLQGMQEWIHTRNRKRFCCPPTPCSRRASKGKIGRGKEASNDLRTEADQQRATRPGQAQPQQIGI